MYLPGISSFIRWLDWPFLIISCSYLAVTPTVGVSFMMGQDLLDNYVIKNLERKIHYRIVLATVRVVLNPTRSLANALAFKKPWYRQRDRRGFGLSACSFTSR